MKNKKIIFIILLLILMTIIFVACNKDEEVPIVDDNTIPQETNTTIAKFYINNYEYNSIEVKEGDKIAAPDITSYLEYTIKYWTKNGSWISFPYVVTKKDIDQGIEIRAVATKNVSITFISNGVEYKNTTAEIGGYVQEPDAPKLDNYKFNCWTLNGEKVSFPYKIDTDQNFTFVADFSKMCKITFMLDNNNVFYSNEIYAGNIITMPPNNPEIKNKRFIYWVDMYDNKVNDNEVVEKDIVLYPLFEDDNFYNVKYFIGDNLYYSSLAKTKAIELDYPEASIFYGWYIDKNLTTAYDFNTTLSSNLNLYAKYVLSDYSIYVSKLGTNKNFNVDITNFNYGFTNYKNTMSIGAKSKTILVTYSFKCNNGNSVYVSYDMLNGEINGKYGVNDGSGSYSTINIKVDKYEYETLSFSNYELVDNGGSYCSRLEALSLNIAKQAYDYVYEILIDFTSDYQEVERLAIPNDNINYSIEKTDRSISVNLDKNVYSIKIINDNNVVAYVKNKDSLVFDEIIQDKDYTIEIVYEYTYNSNIYRTIIIQ